MPLSSAIFRMANNRGSGSNIGCEKASDEAVKSPTQAYERQTRGFGWELMSRRRTIPSRYEREVSKVPPLDAAEEATCVAHIRASDRMADVACQRLVEAHLNRVIALAKVYHNDRVHLLDLIERGNSGLIAAAASLGHVDAGTFWDFARPFVERSLKEFTV